MSLRFSRFLGILVLLCGVGAAPDLDACYRCEYSMHGWGFCRSGYTRGTTYCRGYVADTFNGRTDCETTGWDCDQGGTRIGDCDDCEPYDPHASAPCLWTDTPVLELV